MRRPCIILALLISLCAFGQDAYLQRVIDDIYSQLAESGETDYEDVLDDLQTLAAQPIDLNHTTADELLRLRFLSEQQIDAILLYTYKHPMQELTELQLIPCLADYDIRNLLAFVTLRPDSARESIRIKDMLRHARHEITVRTDARNIENSLPIHTSKDDLRDPFFVQARYKLNISNRLQFGVQLRRPPSGGEKDLQYGAYLQLNDLGAVHTLVAGNFQAGFGQGLVFAPAFHNGRSAYVLTAGNAPEGLRKYSSTDDAGLHGAGTTVRIQKGKTRIDISALYSMQAANDSIWRHVLGGNITIRRQHWKIGITMAENLYSDTLRLYRNMAYNQHYFRGIRQAVIGVNARYHRSWWDLFGEVATAQNKTWGVAAQAGCRMQPVAGVGLIALYRYYSPWFDNTLGYSLSQTSRINDENGLYIGLDVSRLRNWRFALYGDVFRFEGVKYGIPYAPSMGYETMGEITYAPKREWQMTLRLRAREKGRKELYSARYRYEWARGRWYLRTQAEANLTNDSTGQAGWGVSVLQDVEYTCARVPLTLQGRVQCFDARAYANRIYTGEHDVLYGYSLPYVYGQGVRMYVNARYRIANQVSMYLRVSETIYSKQTYTQRQTAPTRTDIHLLVRVSL